MSAEGDDRTSEPLLSEPTEANVDALLETVRELLRSEEARDQSFNSRGVGLAGFVGIIVSLSTTLGRDALSANLNAPWEGITIALFGAALVFLLATVSVVVIGVLRPREAAFLGFEEVEKYPTYEYVLAPRVMNQGRIMRGLIEALGLERQRGTSKARALRHAYGLLLGGLSCIAVLGFILGLHDAGIIGSDDERRQSASGAHSGRLAGPNPAQRSADVRPAFRHAVRATRRGVGSEGPRRARRGA